MERWMALDDFKFSVVSDDECKVMPPEADPNPPSTSTTTTVKPSTTTVKPYEGIC